ncbi:MAG: hypothetical protein RLN90_02735 [Balneolaceae bacterium]
MKKLSLIIILFISGSSAMAQNTFPPTGNAEIKSGNLLIETNTWRNSLLTFKDTHYSPGQVYHFQIESDGLKIKQDGNVNYQFRSGGNFLVRNGRIGIGITDPSYQLHLKDPSGGAALALERNGKLWKFDVAHNAASKLFIGHTDQSSLVTLTDQGFVGIGNTSPEMKLDVEGSITLRGETNPSSGSSIVAGWTTSGDFGRIRSRDWSGAQWKRLDFQASSYTFREGNVGIGTTDPSVKLDISGSGTSTTITRISSGGHANYRVSRGSNSYDGGHLFYTGTTLDWRLQESSSGSDLHFRDESLGTNIMTFQDNTGNIGIGTNNPKSKLSVDGQIRATEVKVLADISVPDYVFEPDYELRTLKETKEYITENKHLPEIPSASEIGKNGIDLGDMNMRLLKKIEELTLYQIELLERLEKLETKNARIDELEKKIELLNKN